MFAESGDLDRLANVAWAFLEEDQIKPEFVRKLIDESPELGIRFEDSFSDNIADLDDIDVRWQRAVKCIKEAVEKEDFSRPHVALAKQVSSAASQLVEIAEDAATAEVVKAKFWQGLIALLADSEEICSEHVQLTEIRNMLADRTNHGTVPEDAESVLTTAKDSLALLAREKETVQDLSKNLSSVSLEERSEYLERLSLATKRQKEALNVLDMAFRRLLPPRISGDSVTRPEFVEGNNDVAVVETEMGSLSKQVEPSEMPAGNIDMDESRGSTGLESQDVQQPKFVASSEDSPIGGVVADPHELRVHEQKVADTDLKLGEMNKEDSLDAKVDETKLKKESGSVTLEREHDFPSKLFDNLLRGGQNARAYWLAYSSHGQLIEPNVLGVLYEGGRIRPGTPCRGLLARFLNELANKEMDWTDDERLLFSAAVLQPILFLQPHPHALLQLVSSLAVASTPLAEVVEYLKNACLYQGTTLGSQMLGQDIEQNEIGLRLQGIADKADNFLKRIPHFGFGYAPAKKTLEFLYRPHSDWHRLHTLIAENHRQHLVAVRTLCGRLNPHDIVSNAHQEPELPELKRQLTGSARDKLARHLHDSLMLAAEWMTLVDESSSGGTTDGKSERAANLKRWLEERLPVIQQRLAGLEQTPATIAANFRLADLERQLNGGKRSSPSIDEACIDLPNMPLDEDMVPLEDHLPRLAEAIHRVEAEGINPRDVFVECLKRDEFERAELLIRRHDLGDAEIKRTERRRDGRRQELMHSLSNLQIEVEDAFLLGQLSSPGDQPGDDDREPLARSNLLSLVNEGMSKLEVGSVGLNGNIRAVASVAQQIEERVGEMVEERRSRLDIERARLVTQFPDNDQGQGGREYFERAFSDCTQNQDHVAAFDLLDRARYAVTHQEPIVRATVGTSEYLGRFLEQADAYREELGQPEGVRRLIDSIQTNKTAFEIPFSQLDSARRRESLSAIQKWGELGSYRIERVGNKAADAVAEICRFIGFTLVSDGTSQRGSARDGLTRFHSKLYASPTTSPIPTYGSLLGSGLNVVVSQSRKEPEQIAEFLRQEKIQDEAVLVLLMHPESSNYRLKWQRECSASHLMALPLDLCLLVHLCGQRNRLHALFGIGIPFIWSRPYITMGETVAREMFVGRQAEVDSLIDADGGCIVFGGRQLGKSALLTHVRREHHEPQQGTFIAYLDIDDLGNEPQTHEEMVRALWERVAEQLANEGAIDKLDRHAMRSSRGRNDAVPNAIVHALGKDDSKRIILLLDETDDLLDCDSGRDFALVRRLRALMAETGRRFKVVFAGLQSVQRYKNWENHPFAQLGTEMVINPLPPAAAQELIIRPFRALGFAFESTRFVLRILSLANYHPGLIQIFCYRLLEKLYAKWQRTKTNSPIRLISSDDIMNVERDESLREDIRNRFDWTLDLDDRYKVITYGLVLTSDASTPRMESQFMQLGRDWWPAVFESMDPQGLRAVLEEMVGLGVLLREQEDLTSRYRLRSPNLLRLLGPQEAIEGELERIISLDRPTRPNPRNFHTIIDRRPVVF